jgi:hypothetical protein
VSHAWQLPTTRARFNYSAATTLPWGASKNDVLDGGFQNYAFQFPRKAAEGTIVLFE